MIEMVVSSPTSLNLQESASLVVIRKFPQGILQKLLCLTYYSYYIRSKSSPELYWLEKGGLIYATKQGRTRFTFRLDGDRDSDRNRTVIIGKDYISISAVGGSTQKYVSVNDNGEVVLSGHSCRMYYNDLKNMYLAQGEIDNLGNASLMKADGFGEEWELVR